MSVVKKSDGKPRSYKGFCTDLIINFAEHFEMRYSTFESIKHPSTPTTKHVISQPTKNKSGIHTEE